MSCGSTWKRRRLMDDGQPPDPFGPMHTGCVAILEMYRNFRAAGGGWVESAVLVAAQITVSGRVSDSDGNVQ
jgi:hypothetical protein